ncbi:MAG: Uma2 family endonuclease [Turicibacter sp.]|nr:Uma2 family endonuclease [Turicibacter sp.]
MDEKDLEKEKEKARGKDITYDVELEAQIISEARAAYEVDRVYTYEDYLKMEWPDNEWLELIDGVIYHIPAPSTKHQLLLHRLAVRFGNYLHGRSCDVYFAPFGVRIDLEIGKDSVVLPDLVLICDKEKLDEQGLNGAPDLIIEVLSRSTAGKDKVVKYNKYLSVGVKEYWLIDQYKEEVMVNVLTRGWYEQTVYVKGDVIKPTVLGHLTINVTDLFEGYQGREIEEVEVAREEERGNAEIAMTSEKLGIARKLLARGISIEEVAQDLNLAIDVIKEVS